MAEFSSLHSYKEFAQSVTSEARYIHTPSVRSFLEAVKETSKTRERLLRKGEPFYRAQRGSAWRTEQIAEGETAEVECAFPPERMIPNAKFVGHGRANPRGIACLYVATSSETAMAEIRPWIQSSISLAAFEIARDCRIVDCSVDASRSWIIELDSLLAGIAKTYQFTANEQEKAVWGDIAYAFSKPVEASESELSYLPTQILAEFFRDAGYDGVSYNSLLVKGGRNIALFDLSAAQLLNYGLHVVESISYSFQERDSPYYLNLRGEPEASSSENDHDRKEDFT